jgi:UTP--glucose-1-phosphate uridylyltransferase
LIDAINLLNKKGVPVYAVEIENGKYYDTGNKLEYMKTVVEMALQHKELNPEFREFLKDVNNRD